MRTGKENLVLLKSRRLVGLRQEDAAEYLHVSLRLYSDWERGVVKCPKPYQEWFKMKMEELRVRLDNPYKAPISRAAVSVEDSHIGR